MDIRRFNMIDEIRFLDIDAGYIECRTHVSIDEEIFEHHFPDHPVLPGAYLIESMAQCCAHYVLTENKFERLPILVGVEKSRFKCFVEPGEELVVKATMIRSRGNLYNFQAEVRGGERLCAESGVVMTCMPYSRQGLTDLFPVRRLRGDLVVQEALRNAV